MSQSHLHYTKVKHVSITTLQIIKRFHFHVHGELCPPRTSTRGREESVQELSEVSIHQEMGILMITPHEHFHEADIFTPGFNVLHSVREKSKAWRFSLIFSGLKLLGMTATPYWMLKRKTTWAVILLHLFRSAPFNEGGEDIFVQVGFLVVPKGLYAIMTMSCCWQNFKSFGWV